QLPQGHLHGPLDCHCFGHGLIVSGIKVQNGSDGRPSSSACSCSLSYLASCRRVVSSAASREAGMGPIGLASIGVGVGAAVVVILVGARQPEPAAYATIQTQLVAVAAIQPAVVASPLTLDGTIEPRPLPEPVLLPVQPPEPEGPVGS